MDHSIENQTTREVAATHPLPRGSSGREDGPEGTAPRRDIHLRGRRLWVELDSLLVLLRPRHRRRWPGVSRCARSHAPPGPPAGRKDASVGHTPRHTSGRRVPHSTRGDSGFTPASPDPAAPGPVAGTSPAPQTAFPCDKHGFLGPLALRPTMGNTSRSCLPKISRSFFRDRERFFTALLTWQLFPTVPRSRDSSFSPARSWARGSSSGRCTCHFARRELTKSPAKPRVRVSKVHDDGEQRAEFRGLLGKHPASWRKHRRERPASPQVAGLCPAAWTESQPRPHGSSLTDTRFHGVLYYYSFLSFIFMNVYFRKR